MFHNDEEIILASSSPRRVEFLKLLGIEFKVIPSTIDEEKYRGFSPREMVSTLSLEKSLNVASKFNNAWVIGADTDVVINNQSLGKPKDKVEEKEMLETLSGRTHQVISSFSLVNLSLNIKDSCITSTDVTFETLSNNLIDAYIKTGEGDDKAGAYALQGISTAFIRSISGSYSSVIGLDLSSLVAMLLKYNVISCK